MITIDFMFMVQTGEDTFEPDYIEGVTSLADLEEALEEKELSYDDLEGWKCTDADNGFTCDLLDNIIEWKPKDIDDLQKIDNLSLEEAARLYAYNEHYGLTVEGIETVLSMSGQAVSIYQADDAIELAHIMVGDGSFGDVSELIDADLINWEAVAEYLTEGVEPYEPVEVDGKTFYYKMH